MNRELDKQVAKAIGCKVGQYTDYNGCLCSDLAGGCPPHAVRWQDGPATCYGLKTYSSNIEYALEASKEVSLDSISFTYNPYDDPVTCVLHVSQVGAIIGEGESEAEALCQAILKYYG